jgi:adenylate kinase
MIVILLGAPGAGKGTQSKVLAVKYGLQHLATGDIFRAEIAAKSTLGVKAQDYVKSGKLVPDTLVVEMVAGKLQPGTNYLLDGFPRNLEQAQALDKFLAKDKASISAVIYLNLPNAEAMKRLTSRRTCSKCGEVYNVLTKPPQAEGKCDACGGDVVQREDDSDATAKKRLMVFEDLTQPLVAYYKAEQVFHEVNAAQAPEKVSADLYAVIDQIAAVR